MAGDRGVGDTQIVTGTSTQEIGSPKYLLEKIVAFANSVGPGKITNPLDQERFTAENIFDPAFNSHFGEDLGQGIKKVSLDITAKENFDLVKTWGAFLTEMAKKAETAGLQSRYIPTLGRIESDTVSDITDSLVMKVNENLGGLPGKDNYVQIQFIWNNRKRANTPQQGSGERLFSGLEALKSRLTQDPQAELNRIMISFASRPKAITH